MMELAQFLRLQQVVAAMRAAAEASDWDRFVLLQADYQQMAATLPPLDSVRVDESERAQLVKILQETQAALDVVLPLAQSRQAYLAAELAGAHNTGKLNRTYQP